MYNIPRTNDGMRKYNFCTILFYNINNWISTYSKIKLSSCSSKCNQYAQKGEGLDSLPKMYQGRIKYQFVGIKIV